MGLFDFLVKQKWQYVQKANLNSPIWSTQRDKQFITEAYNRIVWVYSCISAISNAVSSVPWLLYRKGRGGRLIEIDEHPILKILNIQANPYMSSKDFLDYWVTYLATEGKFYAEYINPNMPTELYPLYPHYMYPIPSQKEFIAGFEYRMDDAIRYKSNEILWSKFNDPLDIYQGMSPIRSISRTIDTENEAVDWNKSTLQNSGIPAGVFQITNPSPELSERLGEEWNKRYSGGKNSRKPLILNTDKANYLPIGLSPVDMDFLNQRKVNRIEICSAFGVPSQIVGDPEGQTYSNYAEAQKAFWENTVITKYLEHIKDKLTQDLLPRYADNLELRYDLSNVQALKENEEIKARRVMELFKNGLITRNEARYELDYEDVDTEEQFYYDVVQSGMTQTEEKSMKQTNFPQAGKDEEITLRNSNYPLFPIEYAENIRNEYPDIWDKGGNIQGNDTYRVLKRILEENKTADELTDNDKEIIKMREAWSARHFKDFQLAGTVAQMKWLMIGERGLQHMKDIMNAEKEKKKFNFNVMEDDRLYKQTERERNKFYKSVEKKIAERFTDELIMIEKELRKTKQEDLLQMVDIAFKEDKKNWDSLMTAIYISVIEEFGQKSLNKVSKIKQIEKFNVYDEIIKNFIITTIAEEVRLVTDTTKREIKNIISDSIALGLPIGRFNINEPIENQSTSIAVAIGQLYLEQIIPNRSETIARTEVVSASNAGSYYGAKQAGIEILKRWVATPDDDTRETHVSLLGSVPIGMDELFQVGESLGEYPGDPRLSGKERINCRCTISYVRQER